jgi:glutamine cyclotransferase
MIKILELFAIKTARARKLCWALFLLLAACGRAALPTGSLLLPGTPTVLDTPVLVETTALPTNSPSALLASTAVPTLVQLHLARPPAPAPSAAARTYTCPWALIARMTPVYSYQVIKTYPHDTSAYTQGLIFRDGLLYESTGLHGQSSLREVVLESGEVLQRSDLPPVYFGEGLTELDGKLYQLTWKERTGVIYDLQTFKQLGSFSYQTWGWGLTHDGAQFLMSDGSDRLQFRDSQDLQMTDSIPVVSEGQPVIRLNELEYVEGEVWANIYQTACVARINPASGQVVGWIDISGLLTQQEQRFADVPNGIAYDPQTGRIFVTGKLWPKLFEIEVLPAP